MRRRVARSNHSPQKEEIDAFNLPSLANTANPGLTKQVLDPISEATDVASPFLVSEGGKRGQRKQESSFGQMIPNLNAVQNNSLGGALNSINGGVNNLSNLSQSPFKMLKTVQNLSPQGINLNVLDAGTKGLRSSVDSVGLGAINNVKGVTTAGSGCFGGGVDGPSCFGGGLKGVMNAKNIPGVPNVNGIVNTNNIPGVSNVTNAVKNIPDVKGLTNNIPGASSLTGAVNSANIPGASSLTGALNSGNIPGASSLTGALSSAKFPGASSLTGAMNSANLPGVSNITGAVKSATVPGVSNLTGAFKTGLPGVSNVTGAAGGILSGATPNIPDVSGAYKGYHGDGTQGLTDLAGNAVTGAATSMLPDYGISTSVLNSNVNGINANANNLNFTKGTAGKVLNSQEECCSVM